MRCIFFIIVIFLIFAAGCTTHLITPRADPFIGTWQNPTNLVRLQIFENHSVFATAEDLCNISEVPFEHDHDLCTSYVFTDGNWMYGPNQTYDVTLLGNISKCGSPTPVFYRCYTAPQSRYFYFSYDKVTDSISEKNYGAHWQRVSY